MVAAMLPTPQSVSASATSTIGWSARTFPFLYCIWVSVAESMNVGFPSFRNRPMHNLQMQRQRSAYWQPSALKCTCCMEHFETFCLYEQLKLAHQAQFGIHSNTQAAQNCQWPCVGCRCRGNGQISCRYEFPKHSLGWLTS